MKRWFCLLAMLLASVVALPAQTPTSEQIKWDLIGHTMGGRQKCWKFQSVDQIKELTVKNETEHGHQCTCTIALELQPTNCPAQYAAQARVHYVKTAAGWKLENVGLLSLKKVK